jgi:tmRNA-binding protein
MAKKVCNFLYQRGNSILNVRRATLTKKQIEKFSQNNRNLSFTVVPLNYLLKSEFKFYFKNHYSYTDKKKSSSFGI